MKYWFYDGKAAQGPYEEDELKKLPGFDVQSLICPEDSTSPDQWKAAQYYLIKPPVKKAAEAAKLPERTRMGRLAEIERVAEKPSPEGPEPRLETRRSRSGGRWLLILAASSVVAAAIYFRPLVVPRLLFLEDALRPSPSEVQDQNGADRAIRLTRNFPVRGSGLRYPAGVEDVLFPGRWRKPGTLSELVKMRDLRFLAFQTLDFLKQAGLGVQGARRSIGENPEAWRARAENFLSGCGVQWKASAVSRSLWRVSFTDSCLNGLSGPKSVFEIDEARGTVRPLNFNAWRDMDPSSLAAWAARHLQLGALDPEALEQATTAYSSAGSASRGELGRPKRSARARPFPAARTRKAFSPGQTSSAAALARPALLPSQGNQGSPAPDKGAAARKNAANMSLGELQNYLKRGRDSGPNQAP